MGRGAVYFTDYELSLFSVPGGCHVCPPIIPLSDRAAVTTPAHSAPAGKDIGSTRRNLDSTARICADCFHRNQYWTPPRSAPVARTGIFRPRYPGMGNTCDWAILFSRRSMDESQ